MRRDRRSAAICSRMRTEMSGSRPDGRLVQDQELRVVDEGLGQREPLLEPRRQLVVGHPGVRRQLELLEQGGHPRPANRRRRARSSARRRRGSRAA